MNVGADDIKTATAVVSTALAVVKVAPPIGKRRRQASPELRGGAYVRFHEAVFEVLAQLGQLAEMTPTYYRWGSWWLFPHMLRTVDGVKASLTNLLSALVKVRMYGNKEPREVAERLTALLEKLNATRPTSTNSRERSRQRQEYAAVLAEISEAQRTFTLIGRQDLGYDKRLRKWWWQIWRPTEHPPWPGGWPVRR